jgi:hypothetical protein
VSQAAAYLKALNPEQRRAVEHGVRENDCTPRVALLVIAGAGSGKTNTLAYVEPGDGSCDRTLDTILGILDHGEGGPGDHKQAASHAAV